MQTHHLRVQRSARFHTLGDPEGDWKEVWFVLHGYGQLAERFLAEFEPAVRPGRLFVAPEGLSRFYLRGPGGRVGASWMTREGRDHEIEDYVAWLDAVRAQLFERGKGERSQLGVLGFSQGTATAVRWAVLGQVHPARLVLWAGGVPPDLDPEASRVALAGTSIDLAWGECDEVLPSGWVSEEVQRLRALGLEASCHGFEGGHRIDVDLLVKVLDRN